MVKYFSRMVTTYVFSTYPRRIAIYCVYSIFQRIAAHNLYLVIGRLSFSSHLFLSSVVCPFFPVPVCYCYRSWTGSVLSSVYCLLVWWSSAVSLLQLFYIVSSVCTSLFLTPVASTNLWHIILAVSARRLNISMYNCV